MLETLNSPQMLHSATVHMPVALSILGLPLILLCIAVPAKHWQFRLMAAMAFLALVGAAYVGVETGERARSEVPPTIRTEAAELLDTHEEWAEMIWIPAAITAALLLISLIPFKWIQLPYVYRTLLAVALIGSLACSYIAYEAGHAGGMLVYKHGIGVPQPETEFASSTTTENTDAADGTTSTEMVQEEEKKDKTVATRPIDEAEAAQISFKNDVWPLIEQYCIECHGEDEWEMDSEYDMRTVEAMMIAGEKELPVPPLVPGDPDGSSIVKYITGEYKPIMPKKQEPMTEDEVHIIRMWIAAGAIDDTKEAAAPEPEPEPVAEEMPAEETPPASEPAPEPEPTEESTTDAPDPNDGIESPPNDVDPDLKALKESQLPENIIFEDVEPPQAPPQIADPNSPTIQAPRPIQPKVYELKRRDLAEGRIII